MLVLISSYIEQSQQNYTMFGEELPLYLHMKNVSVALLYTGVVL